MSGNKKSIWSVIILIATILSLIALAVSVILTAVGIPVVLEAARQAALDEGVTAEDAAIIAGVAIGTIIAALVIGSLFDILKIIGGFMFSLKGRWGIFCIIVSILSVATGIWALVNDITNKASGGAIASTSVSLALSLLICFACFMHRAELKK